MKKHYKTLRLILGDQLNAEHSWFRHKDESTLYLIAEMHQETGYVKHHVQKICAFFKAMEKFALALREAGHEVLHLSLDDTDKYSTLDALVNAIAEEHQCQHFQYQRPDEYRLLVQLRELKLNGDCSKNEVDSEHFLLPFDEIDQEFAEGKHVRMEMFYRRMRKRFDILMEGKKPLGERWNFDSENRKALKTEDIKDVPEPLTFSDDVTDILERLERHQVNHFGEVCTQLIWPSSRKQALTLLEHFCRHCLPHFGDYQDAMTDRSEHAWSLFHSRLSFALNSKILHPKQVIQQALDAYGQSEGLISLSQIEGFVRQVLGWREYVRGVYWRNMPKYAGHNYFEASRALPEWFWTSNTRMHCMQQAIDQSLKYSYAHHIQRLMITGNFALLAGLDPDAVDRWYLGIYIDAIEWVELPNTRGMSQFADGGLIATKPYAASGNYVNKMSDYCKNCHYQAKEKTGDKACPLNSLYWHFLDRHSDLLGNNPRMAFPYKAWQRMSEDDKHAILDKADQVLENIQNL